MITLSQTFAALSDVTRRGIVVHLATRDATVSELVDQFSLSQPTISSHLKVLERAGLINKTRVAQTRRCSLRRDRLDSAMAWLEQVQAVFEGNAKRLDALLAELKTTQKQKEQQ